ncbi:hypothetical protein [Riemerella anatipestifer]|uniref:hypothetical protein n=1 Tax=Riemerella anatipestifer TaxID=34085 RepID=UPI002363C882|nr:hypothetical protein [Riemerella anatipestifer]MDD1525276.1 hypothetical protein [Riemerella anatipestifer]MDY3318873.1 hypothetical protein [Riemerella anatipestifer]MDY3325144.1 hypothetical protein [Riemerella anatipestifer]MDY3352867.1 hypothetical protein [Riemerella anatipestifer]
MKTAKKILAILGIIILLLSTIPKLLVLAYFYADDLLKSEYIDNDKTEEYDILISDLEQFADKAEEMTERRDWRVILDFPSLIKELKEMEKRIDDFDESSYEPSPEQTERMLKVLQRMNEINKKIDNN